MKTYTNRLCFSLILVFGALVLLLGCSKEDKESSPAKTEQVAVQPGPATPPAAITGVNVSDPEVLARRKPIVVTFAQAMVAEEALNKDIAEKDMPFTISPAVAGKGRWLTDKSFAFAADEDFAPGTEYSLYFNEDLKSLDKRPARWVLSFRTEAVNLRHVQTGSYDPQTFSLLLHFDFSALVDRRALAEHLGVSNAANNEALELDFSDSPEQGQSQIVTVRLGAHLPELDLAIRKDKPGDAHPLGLGSAYSMKITLPAPGEEGTARLSGAGDEPSPLTFYWPNVGEDDDGRLYARVDMSESLADGYQKEFISVSPNLPYTIDEYGSGLVFGQGLEPGMKVDVSLEPGLTDSAGRVLKERRAVSFNVPDYNGAVRFAEQGSFLTPLFGSRVAVNVINVDQVNVSLRRQYDNNLPFMALEPDDRAKNMMRDMAFKEIAIKGLTHNQAQRRAIDLEALAEGRRGVFMLTLDALAKKADPNTGESYLQYCGDAQRLVVLTDIGVSARVFPSGITVLATGISSAQPIGDAAVKVYSRSNQLIARGFTDADGVFVHQRERVWEDQLDPYIVTVQTGQDNEVDMTFLPLSYDTGLPQEDPALLYYLEYGCEAFVYTPRGVFRPGEQVDLKTFVRDENHQAPEPFPVLFKVISSRGVEVAANVATLSEEGGAACSFTLPASAPTGLYTANVEIPGNEGATLGSMSFSVEDFVPPRLEVNLKPEKEAIEAGQNLAADLSGRYLFGAPGAGLDYELGYRVWADQFEAEDFAGYSFGDAEKSFDSQINLEYMTGVLPESGEQRLDFVPPADWAEAPTVLQALLVAAVREDGGRWVNRTASLRYFPTPWLLGLKPDGENFSPGKELAVDVAAVSPEGQIVESGPLRAEISLIQGNWHTVYRNNRYVYTYDERFIPLHNAALPADSGRARLSYTPAQPGQYLVRVLSQDGAIAASCRVNVYGDAGQALAEGTGRMDQVELSLDKDEYRAGETARLAVKAPFAGTLLLGLEKGAQISTRVINMDAPGAVLDIPVTEGMDPNITITASVIRPVRGENREWHSHRAFGTTALVMSKKPHRLEVSLAAPEKALPLAPVSVPFTVTDEQGVPVEGEFSVALVDEGILSLTGFITPDPLDFFMGRRRATGYSYDAFDALLRPEAKATPLLKPGGGGPMAAAGAYQGSLGTQPVFLAAFAPVVKTDANGQGEVQFDVPEYSGKGRVMIVGASGGRFASGEAPVRFARDLVLEASAPRV
ncbi:hypothetical protein LJC09_04765, partial [Desulfovibrio sp. OttesenSCG-928-F20]|nr:hypothetical protein [Desulfovibrio sp. OttesenSCG-928-F20]